MNFNKSKINNLPSDLQKHFDETQNLFQLSSTGIVSIDYNKKQLYFSLSDAIKINKLNLLLNDFDDLIMNNETKDDLEIYLEDCNINDIPLNELPLNEELVENNYEEITYSYEEMKFLFLIVNLNIRKKKDIERLLSKLNTGEIICVLNCLHFYEIGNNIINKILIILYFRVNNLPINKNKSFLWIFTNLFTENKTCHINDFNDKYKMFIKRKISRDDMLIAIKELKEDRPMSEFMLNKYGNISDWDTSFVIDMSKMFKNADTFNSDISGWDVSNVQNMEHMFYSAHVFNDDISGWNVSNVTNMSHMFIWARVFNSDISDWDVSQVQNMENMFWCADVFNCDISKWDVSNVQNIKYMFYNAINFIAKFGYKVNHKNYFLL